MAQKIYVFSPQAQTGKTTIANYIALELAKTDLVAVVELNRYGAFSSFIHDKVEEKERSLVNVFNNEEIDDNLVQSAIQPKCFYLAKKLDDELLSLYNISEKTYNKTIDYLDKKFDYLLIDLPSNYIEKMLIDAVKKITLDDYFICVLDENIQSFQLLKHYDNYFQDKIIFNPKKTFFVKNKSKEQNEKHLQKIIDSLVAIKSNNKMLNIPFVNDLTLYINEGKILTAGGNRKERKFIKAIKVIVKMLGARVIEEKPKRRFNFLKKGGDNADRQTTNSKDNGES